MGFQEIIAIITLLVIIGGVWLRLEISIADLKARIELMTKEVDWQETQISSKASIQTVNQIKNDLEESICELKKDLMDQQKAVHEDVKWIRDTLVSYMKK